MNCHPSEICGKINAPPSKSYMQRAVAASLLSGEKVSISNISRSLDSLASIRVANQLGANHEIIGDILVAHGGLKPRSGNLDCGESGLCMRMFTPIAALADREIYLNASGTLRSRAMHSIVDTLTTLGVDCSASAGMAPIRVKGPLQGGEATLDSSVTSQFLTGLLMALPLAKRNSKLTAINLSSIPYVKMTLDVLEKCGVQIYWDGGEVFSIPGNQKYKMQNFCVEGDWSGSAFALVAGAIAGSVKVSGLNPESLQADRAILEVLELVGVDVTIRGMEVAARRNILRSFTFDVSECPDLAPPLAVLAAFCSGVSRITGIDRLVFKESNRVEALSEELGRIGVSIRDSGSCLEIEGGDVAGGRADARGDHRIAMALAVTAFRSRNGVLVSGANSVSKSYPHFFNDMISLGVNISE